MFRHNLLCLGLALFLASPASAAFERLPQGPRWAALGVLNPPGSCTVHLLSPPIGQQPDYVEASVFIAPQLYGCGGLAYGGAVARFPLLSGLCSVAATRFGSPLYREQLLSLGVFTPLFDGCAMGCAGNLYDLSIAGYGRAFSFGVDAALAISLGHLATYYCCLLNLNAPTIGKVRERLPQALIAGLVIQPARPVCLTAEFLKDMANDVEFRTGIEYSLVKSIALRAGVAPSTSSYGAGCTIGHGGISVEYALTSHRELGTTHWFSVCWQGG